MGTLTRRARWWCCYSPPRGTWWSAYTVAFARRKWTWWASYNPPSSPRRTRLRRLGPASFLSLSLSCFLSVVPSPAVHPTPPYRPQAPSCNRGCPFGDPFSLPRLPLASLSSYCVVVDDRAHRSLHPLSLTMNTAGHSGQPYLSLSRDVPCKRRPGTTSDEEWEREKRRSVKCAEKRTRDRRREKQRGKWMTRNEEEQDKRQVRAAYPATTTSPYFAQSERDRQTHTLARPARLFSRHGRGELAAVARIHNSSSSSSLSAKSAGHHAYVHARMHISPRTERTDRPTHTRIFVPHYAHMNTQHPRAGAYAVASARCSFVSQSRIKSRISYWFGRCRVPPKRSRLRPKFHCGGAGDARATGLRTPRNKIYLERRRDA